MAHGIPNVFFENRAIQAPTLEGYTMRFRFSARILVTAFLFLGLGLSCKDSNTPQDEFLKKERAHLSSTGFNLADAGSPDLSGTLQVRIIESQGASKTLYYLATEDASLIKLIFTNDPKLRAFTSLEVWGYWEDSHTFHVDSWWAPNVISRRADSPLIRSPKHHKVAILASPDVTVSRAEALAIANGGVGTFEHFMNETTRGIDTFSTDFFATYSVNNWREKCEQDDSLPLIDPMVAAFNADASVNADEYDHIAIIIPRSCWDWSGAWAWVGGILDNGALRFARVSIYTDNAFSTSLMAHEIGHNLGMGHAQNLNCGDDYYRPNGTGCSVQEYGNYNDVMGSGDNTYWGTPHQRFMGWIGPKQVVTAAKTSRFNLQAADDSGCGIRALRIPVPQETNRYFYIEYRQDRSSSSYSGTGWYDRARQSAVLLSVSRDGGSNQSDNQRIDLGEGRWQGALSQKTYDLGRGVTLTVESDIGSGYVTVNVTMPGNGAHRNDLNEMIPQLNDGSFGPRSCSDVEPDPDPEPDPEPQDPGILLPEEGPYQTSSRIKLQYHNLPPSTTHWIAFYKEGASSFDYDAIDWTYIPDTGNAHSGALELDGPQNPGSYEARLFFDDSWTVEQSIRFEVVGDSEDPPIQEPGIYLETNTFDPGSTIRIEYVDLPPSTSHWVALYARNANNFAYGI